MGMERYPQSHPAFQNILEKSFELMRELFLKPMVIFGHPFHVDQGNYHDVRENNNNNAEYFCVSELFIHLLKK